MKVLVIEDERQLAGLLKKGLEENSFMVDLSFDGEEGLYLAENYPYDGIVLDLALPGLDGLAILKSLRAMNRDVPVLIVTAQGEVDERIKGLNTGADDYLPKPFDFEELIARLRTIIRRSKGKPSPILTMADLEIDMNARVVTRAGKKIPFSAREYALLAYLMLNAGRVVGRTELIEHIYATDSEWDSNVIDVFISNLRSKIDRGFDKQLIHTVRGAGYILKGDE